MCNVSFVYLNSIAMSSSRPALELKQQTSSNDTRILYFERPFFHHNLFFFIFRIISISYYTRKQRDRV